MSCLSKGFGIIELVVANQTSGMTFTEIVSGTGYPKASVHRMLKELLDIGALRFEPETGRYRGNLKLASLGTEIIGNFDLRDHVHPFLQALHEETGHTCALGVKDGSAGVYIDKCETSGYAIKLYSEVGKRFPLHCTALGKILLAHCEEDEREHLIAGKPLERITSNTIVDPATLRDQLAKIALQGYALDMEEITRGVICIAAPLFGFGGLNVGAISVAFPSYIDSDRGIQVEIDAVRRQASRISNALAEGRKA